MAIIRLYPQGSTAYRPNEHPRNPGIKQTVSGWSASSTRRLVRWLYSVQLSALPPDSTLWSFTFTVRECPDTPNDWRRLRLAFFKRLSRIGLDQIFWLTEWQRRGVPHLHGIVVLPCSSTEPVSRIWLDVAKRYRPSPGCQNTKPIYDPSGWSEYLAKHSARGVTNYQRSNVNIPRGWEGRTGRLWGHRGDWPTRDPIELVVDHRVFFRWRRLIRSRAVALARKRGDRKALRFARSMLKHSDPVVSRVRGLSVFVPAETALLYIDHLSGFGKIAN